jgi:hypothetical protein
MDAAGFISREIKLGESSEATSELNVAYEIADDERELV